ncbi:MAG: histidine phosphatase family protein [Candidatus Promineifilaceae bacterium]
MRLYLIRHCESENNALWARTGSSDGRSADPLLTEKGEAQAARLAAYLAANQQASPHPHRGGPLRDGFRISHLYTSLMQRSVRTGLAVSRALDLPLVAWIDIHERGGLYLDDEESGELHGQEGPGRAFFAKTYPELLLPEALSEEGWWRRPYEERDMALGRAAQVVDRLLAQHGEGDDNVALITHGGFIQSLLQTLFGIFPAGSPIAAARDVWFKASNGSITCLDITPDLLRLTYLNYIDYMPAELLT